MGANVLPSGDHNQTLALCGLAQISKLFVEKGCCTFRARFPPGDNLSLRTPPEGRGEAQKGLAYVLSL